MMQSPRSNSNVPSLAILGIRGVPAIHGGFETFAEKLSVYLAGQGWKVTVYCQDESIASYTEDFWRGVHRIRLPSRDEGPIESMRFDWRSISDAVRRKYDVTLTLGYNTAVFCARLKLAGIPNAINMDGIEWARAKWSWPIKAWFYINDWAGCLLGDRLVADHPEILNLLKTRTLRPKISMIPYGSDSVTEAPVDILESYGLEPGRYITLIARPEPENSVLEIVRAFSKKPRGVKLCVLGRYDPRHAFHARVLESASNEVEFLGPIFDKHIVRSLRFYSLAYVHGHRVGGTNPSLVEALGAGNPILAHDNRFNRWVAGEAALYFSDESECSERIAELIDDPLRLELLGAAARTRHHAVFTWPSILKQYEEFLLAMSCRSAYSASGSIGKKT